MREDRGQGPPWRGGTGPGWSGPPFGPGRRFRRGAFVALLAVALLVAALATILASIIAGNAPAPGITIAVSSVALNIGELFPVNLILGIWLANALGSPARHGKR